MATFPNIIDLTDLSLWSDATDFDGYPPWEEKVRQGQLSTDEKRILEGYLMLFVHQSYENLYLSVWRFEDPAVSLQSYFSAKAKKNVTFTTRQCQWGPHYRLFMEEAETGKLYYGYDEDSLCAMKTCYEAELRRAGISKTE